MGRDRVRALLRGWVDNVVSAEGGAYVLGGLEAAVPIFNGNVMLDIDVRSGSTGRTLAIKDPLIHASVFINRYFVSCRAAPASCMAM